MRQITSVEQYQLAAAKIASQVRSDAAFIRQIRSDPLGTLNSLGIGSDAAYELVREDASLRSQAGISHNSFNDDCTVTCICSSSCCVTCWTTTDLWLTGGSLPDQVVFGRNDPVLEVSPAKEKLLNVLIERGQFNAPI